ncbi:MAG TPA: hypothetical protein VNH65_07450 [Candidatus Acidoferrum sp.]|nr:hypothetical protein [Candidatus Acidoferrum sp.]
MDRRKFLSNLAVTTAAIQNLVQDADAAMFAHSMASHPSIDSDGPPGKSTEPNLEGYTQVSEFKIGSTIWMVFEDLRTRDGSIVFVSSRRTTRVLPKTAEAAFVEASTPYLGLKLEEIGTTARDLLADRLLEKGDPDPDMVKLAAPPQGSARGESNPFRRYRWDAFVGTKECFDTMPVYPPGSTRTYHPGQYFPDLNNAMAMQRYDGLLGGWMPAVRKIFQKSDTAYYELLVFGDVEAHDKFIVQTWHRTVFIENGKITKAIYGYSYPAFPPARLDPAPEHFYRGLLIFAEYWERQLHDFAPTSLPQDVWTDMSRHAFVKELMVRPGGVYPKYGAVDRDYYGPEYDGFQDIFTMSAYTNLEWGRFDPARQIIDNYLTDFVDAKGVNNMRGPETAQFGMTLSLLARYFNYTRDASLLLKHSPKIEATAAILTQLHDESLKLPENDPGHGLIHGWSESDSCLAPKPMTWWLPYFANNAYAARGLKDIADVWPSIHGKQDTAISKKTAEEWLKRSRTLREAVVASMEKSVRNDMNPPYLGIFPGATLTFWESMQKEKPSPHQWAHRAYAELLQADVLPPKLSNLVIDCMRAYGATTVGIVANVEPPHPTGRDILGFISYGYAQMLLRLDRVEEYLLFLYAHRFHDHTRGSWVAGEVSGIGGGTATFCIPAQQTIPLLVRWMLVLEDSDEEKLYFGKGLPRDWVISGKEIKIQQAPTRWGRVDFSMQASLAKRNVVAHVGLPKAGSPAEIAVKFRLPSGYSMASVSVNGQPAQFFGLHGDTVATQTHSAKNFEIIAEYKQPA